MALRNKKGCFWGLRVWAEYKFQLYGKRRMAQTAVQASDYHFICIRFLWVLQTSERNRRSARVPFWLHLITVIGSQLWLASTFYKCETSRVNKENVCLFACERDRFIPCRTGRKSRRRRMNDRSKLKTNRAGETPDVNKRTLLRSICTSHLQNIHRLHLYCRTRDKTNKSKNYEE